MLITLARYITHGSLVILPEVVQHQEGVECKLCLSMCDITEIGYQFWLETPLFICLQLNAFARDR